MITKIYFFLHFHDSLKESLDSKILLKNRFTSDLLQQQILKSKNYFFWRKNGQHIAKTHSMKSLNKILNTILVLKFRTFLLGGSLGSDRKNKFLPDN